MTTVLLLEGPIIFVVSLKINNTRGNGKALASN